MKRRALLAAAAATAATLGARRAWSTRPDSGMAGLFGPIGRAIPDGEGAYRVTGRWPFNSGWLN